MAEKAEQDGSDAGMEKPVEALTKAMMGEAQELHVLVDGEEYIAHSGLDSVMFENVRTGKIWGVMRDKIKLCKLTGTPSDPLETRGAILAWEVNGEIESVELRSMPIPGTNFTPTISFLCGGLGI